MWFVRLNSHLYWPDLDVDFFFGINPYYLDRYPLNAKF